MDLWGRTRDSDCFAQICPPLPRRRPFSRHVGAAVDVDHLALDELGGGADQFSIAGGKPGLGLKQYEFAGYGQANYSLTETIGLSFGVRYENQTNVHDSSNIAPRFGFVWQPKTKDKQRPITTLPRVTMGV